MLRVLRDTEPAVPRAASDANAGSISAEPTGPSALSPASCGSSLPSYASTSTGDSGTPKLPGGCGLVSLSSGVHVCSDHAINLLVLAAHLAQWLTIDGALKCTTRHLNTTSPRANFTNTTQPNIKMTANSANTSCQLPVVSKMNPVARLASTPANAPDVLLIPINGPAHLGPMSTIFVQYPAM